MAEPDRLPGHGLVREGAPYAADGTPAGTSVHGYQLRGGEGHGKCTCGEMSPLLPSSYKRRQWHREHKAHVRATLGQRGPLNALVGEILGCDPATISEDGFTVTLLAGGAIVHVTLVKRLTHDEASRLGVALDRAYAR